MDMTDYAWVASALPAGWWLWSKVRRHMKLRIRFELNLQAEPERQRDEKK